MFLAADVSSTAFNRPEPWAMQKQDEIAVTAGDLPMLEAEIEALISEGECGAFVAESPQKLRRIVSHYRARLGTAAWEAPRCNAPWVSAVLETDGTVRPCFFHPPIGRIGDTHSLLEILKRPTAIHSAAVSMWQPTQPAAAACARCTGQVHREPLA